MGDARLTVRGTEHLGWTTVTVNRAVEQLASTFQIDLTERWAVDKEPVPIAEGDICDLWLDDKKAVVGYVDDADINYDAKTHTMHVAGRSKTGDLIDCAAVYTAGHGQWRSCTLRTIAENICDPFGISVTATADLGAKFRRFALQEGETAHEALERACRMRGVLMMTSGDGNLVLTRAGTATTKTVIQYGINVIAGGRSGSWRERFSKYTLKSQVAGDDDFMGRAAAQPKRSSVDPDVKRYRPTIILAEGQETGAELQKRADWERNIRIGKSRRLAYTLHGWTNDEGLWEPNTLARVIDPMLEVDATLLVVSVKQSKGDDGSVTELELADPASLSVEPITRKPKTKASFL